MSRRRAWLFVLVSLLDDFAVLAIIILGLWYFHVAITWFVILIIALIMAAFIFIVHRAIVPGLLRKKAVGAEQMVGLCGTVTESLCPRGLVRIEGETWQAVSAEGTIGVGEEVVVTRITGLSLDVRRKTT